MNQKEKILLIITSLLAAYNLVEIVIASSSYWTSINGYFDLILPLVVVANLVWVIWRRNKFSFIGLALCIISIIGVFMILNAAGPFYSE